MNANDKPTPEQSLTLLKELAAHPIVKLSLQEHSAIQQALTVLEKLVKPPVAEESK